MSHTPSSSLGQRLYRQQYEKEKDKIHSTLDTPDIKQVKMNQENLSEVIQRQYSHFYWMPNHETWNMKS